MPNTFALSNPRGLADIPKWIYWDLGSIEFTALILAPRQEEGDRKSRRCTMNRGVFGLRVKRDGDSGIRKQET